MIRLLRRLFGFSGAEPVAPAPFAPVPSSPESSVSAMPESAPASAGQEAASAGDAPADLVAAEPVPTALEPQYDVFISYSHDDREEALFLERDLQRAGLTVWRDDRIHASPEPHSAGAIRDAFRLSARILVLWSDRSVKSAWVREEAEAARSAQKIVCLALTPFAALDVPASYRNLPTSGLAEIRDDPALLLRDLGALEDFNRPGSFALVEPSLAIGRLAHTFAPSLLGRDRELRLLTETWDKGGANVIAFDAVGGAGKTAIIAHFLQGLQSCAWRGAQAVFAWSFHSQGASQERQANSAAFFREAFAFFARGGPSAAWQSRQDQAVKLGLEASAWPPEDERDKGEELARHVQTTRALLILDGLEPLQCGSETRSQAGGTLKDPAMAALLAALADSNPGLCLVSSRFELVEFRNRGGLLALPLPPLDTTAAMGLLRSLGVEPQYPSADYLSCRHLLGEEDRFGAAPAPAAAASGSWHLPTYGDFASRLAVEIQARQVPRDYRLPDDLVQTLEAVDRSQGEPFPPPLAFKLLLTAIRFEGHALSLTLLGNFLRVFYHGSLDAVREVPLLEIFGDAERKPFSVMRAIETALVRQLADPTRDRNQHPGEADAGRRLAILLFLGFFDRPAPVNLFPVVFSQSEWGWNPEEDPPVGIAGLEAVYRKQDAHTGEWEPDEVWQPRALKIETERRALFRTLFLWTPGYSESQLQEALRRLAAQGLVNRPRGGEEHGPLGIDCHPSVREYFAGRLRSLDPAGFAALHGRLYDWHRFRDLPEEFRNPVGYALLADQVCYPDYGAKRTLQELLGGEMTEENKANTPRALVEAASDELQAAAARLDEPVFQAALAKFRPEDAAALEPLFEAVIHGCLAGRHDECFREVYWLRIARGNENFAAASLGLIGEDLTALACFFERPFAVPSPMLEPSAQGVILSLAAFTLRILGRYADAVGPMRAGVDSSVQNRDWKGAASDAGNLSHLLVTLGCLEDAEAEEGALATAARAVAFAEQSGDSYEREKRTFQLGTALLARGRLREAEQRFREAERLQKQREPGLSRLYSLAGFHYGDLLLARRRVQEVEERYRYLVSIRQPADGLLDLALEELIHARAAAASGGIQSGLFDLALAALQNAHAQEFTVSGQLALAEALLSAQGAATGSGGSAAAVDAVDAVLDAAEGIARRGPLPLFLAEVHLLRARAALMRGDQPDAIWQHRNSAAGLIQEHHAGRREPDLALLDAEIGRSGETFQAACEAVGAEGWWHLMPRLEALAPQIPGAAANLAPLLAAESAYHAERDAWLAGEQ